MDIVDPERLREIRTARGRSQKSLEEARVISERQLVRIEKANGPVKVRKSTIQRLVAELDVGADVLAGTAPLPEGLSVDAGMASIEPRALSAVRRRRDWSRRQLSEESRIPEQRIRTVEKGTETVSIPKRELTRLAKALTVEEPILSGERPLEEVPPLPADVGVSLKTTPALRLAYELVERRYGASTKDLFVLAPLLFVLLAEGSLASRGRKLEEAKKASAALEEMAERHPTLYFGKRQSVVWQGIDQEQASINAADVLGRKVWDSDWSIVHDFSEDDTNITPFADYLADLAKDIDDDLVNFDSALLADQGLVPWGANPYQVCRGELQKVVAVPNPGQFEERWESDWWESVSAMAQAALEWGDVRLSEIPEELMVPETWERRLELLKSELSADTRKYAEWVSQERERERWHEEERDLDEMALDAGDEEAWRRLHAMDPHDEAAGASNESE